MEDNFNKWHSSHSLLHDPLISLIILNLWKNVFVARFFHWKLISNISVLIRLKVKLFQLLFPMIFIFLMITIVLKLFGVIVNIKTNKNFITSQLLALLSNDLYKLIPVSEIIHLFTANYREQNYFIVFRWNLEEILNFFFQVLSKFCRSFTTFLFAMDL